MSEETRLQVAGPSDDEVWETWEGDKREKFGERWQEVKAVLAALEYYGIHMLDVNPGNVALGLK